MNQALFTPVNQKVPTFQYFGEASSLIKPGLKRGRPGSLSSIDSPAIIDLKRMKSSF